MEKKNRQRFITAAIVIILCAIFFGGFVWGIDSVLAMEGSFPPTENVAGKTAAPKTNQEAVAFLDYVVEKAITEKPKTENSDSFDIDEKTISCNYSDSFKSSLLYAREDFCNTISNSFESKSADFSGDNSKIVRIPAITAEDIKSFECNYIYYECISCGEKSDTSLDGCEKCGSTYPYVMKYRDSYEIVLHLKNDNAVLEKNYSPRSDKEINALTADGIRHVLTVDSLDISYNTLTITFQVDRATDELTRLEYSKEMPVKASVAFVKEYSSIGKGQVEFTLTEKNEFHFTWPSLKLSDKTMSIEPKASDNLLATLTCSDPTKATVTWRSSDESVVTVDDEGYLKAGKNPGTATVTASFEFNGKTYSDSCEVSVKTSVESLAMSERKITLKPGEKHTLVTKVSPSDSTIKTVTWYSGDEAIATVGSDGIVTAVSKGVVTVYALSDDGYFKSSCEVNVE